MNVLAFAGSHDQGAQTRYILVAPNQAVFSLTSKTGSVLNRVPACTHTAGIRDHVVQSVELKFNCFFLMPVVDTFPTRLRTELEAAYEEDLDDVFDVAAVRSALEGRLRSLETELHQVNTLS